MALKDYCFDGNKKLNLKEMPTEAGDYAVLKAELTARTDGIMAEASLLQ